MYRVLSTDGGGEKIPPQITEIPPHPPPEDFEECHVQ